VRKLVLVHGRSQEGKDPEQLKWTWVQSFKEGLAKSGLELPVAYEDIAFPYYGDAIDKLIYGGEEAAVDVITRGAPEDDEELRFKVAMMEAFQAKLGVTDDQVLEASGDATIERGPLNWGWVQGIMSAFDRYVPHVSGAAANLATHDVYLYLKRPGVRDEVDNIVRKTIPDGEETVVVGHSLGSIVTYSVLKRDEAKLKVPLHVTVGSPLGLRLIQDAFNPVRSPACVSAWYNAMDPRDFVALYPLKAPHFNVIPEIENKLDVDNFTSNRHGIVGYLSDKDVAQKIHAALTA
jgi:hypothetical protein